MATGRSTITVRRAPDTGAIAQLLSTWTWAWPPPTRTRSWRGGESSTGEVYPRGSARAHLVRSVARVEFAVQARSPGREETSHEPMAVRPAAGDRAALMGLRA